MSSNAKTRSGDLSFYCNNRILAVTCLSRCGILFCRDCRVYLDTLRLKLRIFGFGISPHTILAGGRDEDGAWKHDLVFYRCLPFLSITLAVLFPRAVPPFYGFIPQHATVACAFFLSQTLPVYQIPHHYHRASSALHESRFSMLSLWLLLLQLELDLVESACLCIWRTSVFQ